MFKGKFFCRISYTHTHTHTHAHIRTQVCVDPFKSPKQIKSRGRLMHETTLRSTWQVICIYTGVYNFPSARESRYTIAAGT